MAQKGRPAALITVFTSSLLLALAPARVCAADEEKIDFARDVQPILSDNCFRCHGPDAGTREADLRLDLPDPKQGPFAPRDGYAIVAPGSVDDSILLMRIEADDDDVKMPPPSSNKTLTPQQIDVLKRWIEQGAPWGKHWAYEKPVRPQIPALKHGLAAERCGPVHPRAAGGGRDRAITGGG